jgi:hypothetical protein
LMSQAIEFGDYILACRERYNPADASNFVQAMENRIIDCFKKKGDMTLRDCMRRVHPHRLPGGVGAFGIASVNLTRNDYLLEVSRDGKKVTYRLMDLKE